MSETPEVWVMVDDADTGILYSNEADWNPDKNILDAFEQTATFSTVSQASFSYRFNGSKVALYSPFSTLNISHETSHPSWECFLDNNSIHTNNSFSNFPIQSLCEADNLDEQEHVISLQIGASTGSGVEVPLYFDYIKYVPLDLGPIPPNTTLSVTSTSLQSALGSSWSTLGKTTAAFTTGSGNANSAIFSITFVGTSLEWYGLSTSAISQATLNTALLLNIAPSSFNYTIDIGSDKSLEFVVEFGATLSGSSYDNMLFRTPQLQSGAHNLTIFFQGGPSLTPLTLDFLAFNSGSGASGSPSSASQTAAPISNLLSSTSDLPGSATGGPLPGVTSSSGPNLPITQPETHKRSSLPSILGGTLGGIAASACMLFIVFLILRMRKRRRHRNYGLPITIVGQKPETQIYVTHVRPFLVNTTVDFEPREKEVQGNVSLSSLPRPVSAGSDTAPGPQGKRQRPMTTALLNSRASHSLSRSPVQRKGSVSNPLNSRLQQLATGDPTGILEVNHGPSNSGAIQEVDRGSHALHMDSGRQEDIDTNFEARHPGGDFPERVVRHEDSGVRLLQNAEEERILELPPNYTPY